MEYSLQGEYLRAFAFSSNWSSTLTQTGRNHKPPPERTSFSFPCRHRAAALLHASSTSSRTLRRGDVPPRRPLHTSTVHPALWWCSSSSPRGGMRCAAGMQDHPPPPRHPDKETPKSRDCKVNILLNLNWCRTEGQQWLKCSLTKRPRMFHVQSLNTVCMDTIEKVVKILSQSERGIHSPLLSLHVHKYCHLLVNFIPFPKRLWNCWPHPSPVRYRNKW